MRTRPTHARTRRYAAAAATTSAVVAAVGLGTAPAAQSAPDDQCPAAAPVSGLTPGDPVTGKTVTSGTEPETFGGSVVGTLEDGIAPGVDMVLVDLDSTTITRVGIWSGMSGSPVYDADGDLIGAVSYSLGLGPSTIARVTPATQIHKQLRANPTHAAPPPAPQPLSSALRQDIAETGAASAADSTTMTRLRVPVGMSGLSTARLKRVAPALNGQGMHVADAPAGPTSSEPIDVAAGGNLAASMSYGTITAAGVGTATAVCGDEVLAFGHPMNFTGPATMSLHGARATHIQDDQTLSGFKVANLGAPIGSVDGDRLAGLHAEKGALPTSYDVSSAASQGSDTRSANTHVTVPALMPEMGFSNMIAAQDRVLDRIGQGTASAGWTIQGLRKDGTPFSFTRSDLYADPNDISVAPAIRLADDLSAIQYNPGEVVKITSVDTTSSLEDAYETYAIQKVQVYRGGRWVTLQQRQPSWLRAGRTAHLKVFLTSREGDPRTLDVSAVVPARASGVFGTLTVTGGDEEAFSADDFFDLEEDGFEEQSPAPSSSTFPKLLKELAAGPKHNEVRATLRFRGAPGAAGKAQQSSVSMNRVVSGYKLYHLLAR